MSLTERKDEMRKARGNLAFSQALMDKLGATKMAQQSQNMPQEMAPQQQQMEQPMQEPPQEEMQEQKGIADTIKETLQPFMDQIKKLVTSEEPKEVALKIDGQMTPKEAEK